MTYCTHSASCNDASSRVVMMDLAPLCVAMLEVEQSRACRDVTLLQADAQAHRCDGGRHTVKG